jgi:membrane dipeptidase
VTTAYADAGRGGARWQGINDRGRLLIAEMNRLGIVIDITHATEAAQQQIIQASRAPVVASHVGMRAVCNNPGNLSDDVLRALASKGGLVGIHSGAANISQRYLDWSRTHPPVPVNGLTLQDVVQAELPLVRSPTQDYGTYIEALDSRMGGLWRQFHAQPWRDAADAELLVPTVDEFAQHVAHAVSVAGPTHVAIGMDLFQGRSHLKDFDARAYPKLVDALRKRNIPSDVLGENWLRMFDAATVQ